VDTATQAIRPSVALRRATGSGCSEREGIIQQRSSRAVRLHDANTGSASTATAVPTRPAGASVTATAAVGTVILLTTTTVRIPSA
jgi:hypothetical protein